MHAVVLNATGGNDGDGPGRVLWRVDGAGQGTTPSLYLLSPSAPDCARLVAETGAAGTQARTLDYSPFLATLDAGQVWAFRLTANPSYSAPRGPEVRGKRYGHVTVPHSTSVRCRAGAEPVCADGFRLRARTWPRTGSAAARRRHPRPAGS